MTLNVLLVGCGDHARDKLIPSIASLPEVQITGLCDPDTNNIDLAKRWFPSASLLINGYEQIENIGQFDAIVVAAPPQVHYSVAKKALSNNVHVFVEKPPTQTIAQLEELSSIALRKKLVTCVGHNLRHSEAAINFQNIVNDSSFGRSVAMEMRYFASKPRGKRWNLDSSLRSFLLSHANHAIDFMIYQMGDIREVVAARGWPDVDGGIAISVQFLFESGAVGNLLATSYAPHFSLSATVVSDKGRIANMDSLNSVTSYGNNDLGKRWSMNWAPKTLQAGYAHAGYKTELKRFFDAIITSSPKSIHPSFSDSLAIYKAIDSIELSIRSAEKSGQI